MKKDIDKAEGYFDSFDFDNAKTIKHPLIQKIQHDDALLEQDIAVWLSHQDKATKQHVNAVIRHFMEVKETVGG